MPKKINLPLLYRVQVLYRFLFVFGIGYACMVLLNLALTQLLHRTLDKPEAIYLAAFISILFYLIFTIVGFCIRSLLKLSIGGMVLCTSLLGLCWIGG